MVQKHNSAELIMIPEFDPKLNHLFAFMHWLYGEFNSRYTYYSVHTYALVGCTIVIMPHIGPGSEPRFQSNALVPRDHGIS